MVFAEKLLRDSGIDKSIVDAVPRHKRASTRLTLQDNGLDKMQRTVEISAMYQWIGRQRRSSPDNPESWDNNAYSDIENRFTRGGLHDSRCDPLHRPWWPSWTVCDDLSVAEGMLSVLCSFVFKSFSAGQFEDVTKHEGDTCPVFREWQFDVVAVAVHLLCRLVTMFVHLKTDEVHDCW